MMLALTYLLFAIVFAIVFGRIGTVCREYFLEYRKKHDLQHPTNQAVKR